jgi:RNA polymerase sigma factor (sigma-70 family)
MRTLATAQTASRPDSRPGSRPGSRPAASAGPLAPLLADLSRITLLTREQETELGRRVQAGDPAAREAFAVANLPLVIRIARLYQDRGLPLADLIQEGVPGLLRAVDGFNPEAGTRFSTYASYWIRQSIERAIVNTARPIRLPVHLYSLLGRNDQEILDCAPGTLTGTRGERARARRIARVRQAEGLIAAQWCGLGDAGRAIASTGTPDQIAMDREERREERRRLRAAVDGLSDPRCRQIIRARFGLDGGKPRTLEAIGREIGLVKERVRQLEQAALAELRERLGQCRD